MKSIEQVKEKDIHDTAWQLTRDMYSCEAGAKAVCKIELPDGRIGELQVVITTNENDFIG